MVKCGVAIGVISLVSLWALSACVTVPSDPPEDLSLELLFQQGQEAYSSNELDIAKNYYQAVIERFTDNEEAVLSAEYELAFISYKQEMFAEAREKFQAIVERYSTQNNLPLWIKALSERMIALIDEKEQPTIPIGE